MVFFESTPNMLPHNCVTNINTYRCSCLLGTSFSIPQQETHRKNGLWQATNSSLIEHTITYSTLK